MARINASIPMLIIFLLNMVSCTSQNLTKEQANRLIKEYREVKSREQAEKGKILTPQIEEYWVPYINLFKPPENYKPQYFIIGDDFTILSITYTGYDTYDENKKGKTYFLKILETIKKKAFDAGDVYRGSTILANSEFSMRVGNFSHPDYDGAIFVLNNAKLMNHTSIGLDGGEPWRNLAHSYTKNGIANSSYGMISAGCFINDAQRLNSIQNYMNATWKVNYPYDVKMIVRNGQNRR